MLTPLKVLELSARDGMTAICGRLLADLGADVRVPAGWPMRPPPDPCARSEQELRYETERLLSGKQIEVEFEAPCVDVGSLLARLLSTCDVLLVDGYWKKKLDDAGLTPVSWPSRFPELVVVYLTAFGLTGPWAGTEDSDLLVQAAAGILSTNGFPGDPPVRAGAPVADVAGAVLGASAALAAVVERRSSGVGQVVDAAGYDAVVCLLGTLLPTVFMSGRSPARIGNRHAMTAPWNTYPMKDGWVVVCTMGERLWRSVATMIGRPDLVEDPRFATNADRVANVEELDAIIGAWSCTLSHLEFARAAEACGVPHAPIRPLSEVLAQVAAADGAHDGRCLPKVPLHWPGPSARPLRRHDHPAPSQAPSRPLAGVRVVELGAFTAGPLAGRLLALLGADVLKVEPPKGENSRHLAGQVEGTGYLYHLNNSDKRGVALDLDDPAQHDRLMALLAEADFLLTNLSPQVLDAYGLTASALAERCPVLTLCRVTAYPSTGAQADAKAFDTVIQAQSGIMSLSGLPEGQPLKAAISFADVLAAAFACLAVVAAVARRPAAAGALEIALYDVAVWSTHRRWVDCFVGGHEPARLGNAEPGRPLTGVYACLDGTVAVDTTDQAQHRALERLVGVSAGAAEWFAARTVSDALEQCAAAAVPSLPVHDLVQVSSAPHTLARELLVPTASRSGTPIVLLGSPWTFSRSEVRVRRRAPDLAEHDPVW